MPLICDLGWHRADPMARWNNGYYFSKCTRCGRDLVRTAYAGWHVPKGYKVVWQNRPPEQHKMGEPMREPLIARPAVSSSARLGAADAELPIQAVLRHLNARDLSSDAGVGYEQGEEPGTPEALAATEALAPVPLEPAAPEQIGSEPVEAAEVVDEPDTPELGAQDQAMAEPAEATADEKEAAGTQQTEQPAEVGDPPAAQDEPEPVEEAVAPRPPAPVSRIAFDDFMEDDSDVISWDDPPPRRYVAPAPVAGPDPGAEDALAERRDRAGLNHRQFERDEMGASAEEASGAAPEEHDRSRSDGNPPADAATSRRRTISFGAQVAVTGALVAGVVALVAAVSDRPRTTAPAGGAGISNSESQAADAPQVSASAETRETGFVTARILNCRSSPVAQASSVKKLWRGATVEILARDEDWLSLSHRGQQCWAAARFISTDRPA